MESKSCDKYRLSIERAKSDKPGLFVNITNHPTSLWKEPQLMAAKAYGDIIDISFPNIDPEASEEEVGMLVDDYISKVIALTQDHIVTVHVMGELNFSFSLVSRLMALGITCVASTTKRDVEDYADGTKKSVFNFVKFRKYVF